LTAASVAGCQRLNHEGTYPIDPGIVQAVEITPPAGEQKVTVDVQASPGSIDVYVVLADNVAAVKEKLLNYKKPDASELKVSKEKMESGTLETTIPSGKAFAVILAGAKKKTEVKLKIKG